MGRMSYQSERKPARKRGSSVHVVAPTNLRRTMDAVSVVVSRANANPVEVSL
jgi:hypothetical protein